MKKRKNINYGEVAVTKAGSLDCKHIIHVTPSLYSKYFTDVIRNKHNNLLKTGVKNIMDAANELGAESISIPPIVIPTHGFTVKKLIEIQIREAVNWCEQNLGKTSIKKVHMVAN